MDEKDFNVRLFSNWYNIEKFMRHHPGGTSMLYNLKDRDIAKQMIKYGHNEYAYHLLEEYRVNRGPVKENGVTNGVANGVTNGVYRNGTENGHANGLKNGHKNGLKNRLENGKNGLVDKNGYRDDNDNDLEEYANKMVERLAEIDKIEALVDWSKPMLDQLKNLGPHYDTWIECPVDKTTRLFANPLLEHMTTTPWYGVLIYWIPIALYLLNYNYKTYVDCGDQCEDEPLTVSSFLLRLFVGVLLWTIIEYVLHRFVFHMRPGKSIGLRKLHFMVHGMHHKTPFDKNRQVFPPVPGSLVAVILHFGILHFTVSKPLVITTGTIIGYLIYDMVHFYLHYGKPKDGTFLYTMRRYHANHHFINPDIGFGITTRFWDNLFQTTIKLKKLGFSLSWD